jgi:hypothetical protein
MRGNGKAAVMIGGSLFRTIDSRNWDAERRLPDMEEDGIATQVVSPMPELLSHWLTAEDADVLADYINESIAELCFAKPRNFIGIGMVPVQDPALAARRLETVRSLGLCGVEIGTHIAGVPLGDARLNEFCARCHVAAHSRGHRTVSATAHIAQPWRRGLALDTSSAAADARVGSFFARTFRSRTRRDGAPILLRYDPL